MHFHDHIDEVLRDIWRVLARGVLRKQDDLNTPAIATFNGRAGSLRTVVLRQVDIGNRTLVFYTDIRSRKIADLREDPRMCWLFYHRDERFQIRADGHARIHHGDEVASIHWRELSAWGRRAYGALAAPGSVLDQPGDALPRHWKGPVIDPDATEYAAENFAVVICEVDSFDWLNLHVHGHQRARFGWSAGQWHGQWLVP